jgi:hypothetical protein
LVGGLGELSIDSEDRLPLGDHQSGEILGEMPTLRLVGKYASESFHGVPYYLRKLDDPWHDCTILGCHVPSQTPPN